ncbi:uncharacterized protein [Amphiura filiformis]|uniref:uncharacterized protein n=1 Tax=Amphiura filiformis TaxID=82378 RepID=UPI003B220138
MAARNTIKEADVSCPVCKEIFNSQLYVPKILPCNHTVCKICLQRLYTESRSSMIKCPLCSIDHNTTVGVLQTNLHAQSIGEKFVPESQRSVGVAWGAFQICVKTIEDKTIMLDVRATNTIRDIKNKIRDKEGLKPEYQQLMHMGKPLRDESATLLNLSIGKDANLHLFKRTLGGARHFN